MSIRQLIAGSVLSGALLLAGAAVAAPPPAAAQPQECVFERYAPLGVAELRSEENVGYGTYTKLRGAQIYVAAQEGLTKEWLTLATQRTLAQPNTASGDEPCDVPVQDVDVSVVSAGGGFWIQLGAADAKAADRVLRWAQTLVSPAAQG